MTTSTVKLSPADWEAGHDLPDVIYSQETGQGFAPSHIYPYNSIPTSFWKGIGYHGPALGFSTGNPESGYGSGYYDGDNEYTANIVADPADTTFGRWWDASGYRMGSRYLSGSFQGKAITSTAVRNVYAKNSKGVWVTITGPYYYATNNIVDSLTMAFVGAFFGNFAGVAAAADAETLAGADTVTALDEVNSMDDFEELGDLGGLDDFGMTGDDYAALFDNTDYSSGEALSASSDAQTVDFGLGSDPAADYGPGDSPDSFTSSGNMTEVNQTLGNTPETATSDFGATSQSQFGQDVTNQFQVGKDTISTVAKVAQTGANVAGQALQPPGSGSKSAGNTSANALQSFLNFFSNNGQSSTGLQKESQINTRNLGQLGSSSMAASSIGGISTTTLMIVAGAALLLVVLIRK